MFDPKMGAYGDYLWREGRTTGMLTAATMFPLFLQLATPAEAQAVAATVQRSLLQQGGLGTTTVQNGQQWDRPNGWAPMQWVAVMGLRRYGIIALAETVATRWVDKTIGGVRTEREPSREIRSGRAGGRCGVRRRVCDADRVWMDERRAGRTDRSLSWVEGEGRSRFGAVRRFGNSDGAQGRPEALPLDPAKGTALRTPS